MSRPHAQTVEMCVLLPSGSSMTSLDSPYSGNGTLLLSQIHAREPEGNVGMMRCLRRCCWRWDDAMMDVVRQARPSFVCAFVRFALCASRFDAHARRDGCLCLSLPSHTSSQACIALLRTEHVGGFAALLAGKIKRAWAAVRRRKYHVERAAWLGKDERGSRLWQSEHRHTRPRGICRNVLVN